jgi:hypothetical protein
MTDGSDDRPGDGPAAERSGVARALLGPRSWWQESIVLFLVYQAYGSARGRLPEPPVASLHHARQLIDVERALGIFREAAIQRWFLPWHPAIELFDIYYGTIHFVVPVVALGLLWRRHRHRYQRYRNGFGFMLVLGLVGFALWPLTPPRLLAPPHRFVDTAATIGGLGPLDRGSMKDDNLYAAMPSLHIGWSTWCALALLPVLRRRWTKALVVAYPVVTLLAVVVTANHYVLDGAGGLAALAVGMAMEDGRRRLGRRTRPADAPGSRRRLGLEPEHLGVAAVDGRPDP